MARDQTMIGQGVNRLWVAHHRDRGIWVGDGRRPTYVVDHVEDATFPRGGQEDREEVAEARRRQSRGDLKRVRGEDVHALVEEAIAAHTVSAKTAHRIGNLEGRPTVYAGSLAPRRLAGWIVGHLVLEENVCAAVAVPDDLELLVVLDEEAKSGNVVAVDDHTGIGGVDRPAHAGAVVRAPCPDIIQDDVAAVDHQAGGRATRRRATDTKEHIGKNRRI